MRLAAGGTPLHRHMFAAHFSTPGWQLRNACPPSVGRAPNTEHDWKCSTFSNTMWLRCMAGRDPTMAEQRICHSQNEVHMGSTHLACQISTQILRFTVDSLSLSPVFPSTSSSI